MRKLMLTMENKLKDFTIQEGTTIMINTKPIKRESRLKYTYENKLVSKKEVIADIQTVLTINSKKIIRVTTMRYSLDNVILKKGELLDRLTTTGKATTVIAKKKVAEIVSRDSVERLNNITNRNLNDLLVDLDRNLEKGEYIEFLGKTDFYARDITSIHNTVNKIRGKHVPFNGTVKQLKSELEKLVPAIRFKGNKIMRNKLTVAEFKTIEKHLLQETAIGYGNMSSEKEDAKVYSKIFIQQIFNFNQVTDNKTIEIMKALKTTELLNRDFKTLAIDSVEYIKKNVSPRGSIVLTDMLTRIKAQRGL